MYLPITEIVTPFSVSAVAIALSSTVESLKFLAKIFTVVKIINIKTKFFFINLPPQISLTKRDI